MQIEVEAKEIERKDRELEATVRRPTEAEAYKVQTLAEGQRYVVIIPFDVDRCAQPELEKVFFRETFQTFIDNFTDDFQLKNLGHYWLYDSSFFLGPSLLPVPELKPRTFVLLVVLKLVQLKL